MIKIYEKGKKYYHSLEEYEKLIKEAKEVTQEAILHFFDLIGLDPELFAHLTKINIVLDLDKSVSYEEMLAFYENINEEDNNYDNTIHILPEYLDSILDSPDKNKMLRDLENTIIHETIHANRSIIMSNGVLCPQSFISSIRDYNNYADKYASFITEGEYKYCVLKVTFGNNFATIIAYNRFSNDFVIFALDNKYLSEIKSTFDVEKLLENKIGLFGLVKTIENPYDINYTGLVSDYSTIYTNSNKVSKKEMLYIESEVFKQRDFEECITEAFARIILYLKDKDSYDITELLNKKNTITDVKLAFILIDHLGIENVRWFFLSCYQDEYRNMFYQIYGDKYFKLIDSFGHIFNCSMNNEKVKSIDEEIKLIKSRKKSNN